MSSVSEENLVRAKEQDDNGQEQNFEQRAGWKALFGFTTRAHLPVLSVAVLSAIVAALTMPAMAVVYGLVFRQFSSLASGHISSSTFLHNVSKYCLYMTGFVGLSWLANTIFFMTFLAFGELQARAARDRLFSALLKREMKWYDTRENGIAAFLPSLQM